jgi:pimeloyl-ACP methyl ester carboxylesterase
MAEVMLDAVSQVTAVPTTFRMDKRHANKGLGGAYPMGYRALQLPDSNTVSYFLASFGRPDRIQTCDCERTNEPRMAQQAAIGQDLLEFMAALRLAPAALAGYDWGGRAACISAILAPERVRALVTIGGYNVQNTVTPAPPASAKAERSYWYQWYFNTERGRQGSENRRDICRLLWQEWSPTW